MKYTKKRRKSHFWVAVGTLIALLIIWIEASPITNDSAARVMIVIWALSLIVIFYLDLKIGKEEAGALTSIIYGVLSPLGAIHLTIAL